MAVPKKKTSKSKSRMRKGSNGTFKHDVPQLVRDKETGEYRLSHHMSSDGKYRGMQIIEKKVKTPKEE